MNVVALLIVGDFLILVVLLGLVIWLAFEVMSIGRGG
jgi:hypothetical protein